MANKKIAIGNTPITNRIVIGTLIRGGTMWGANKKDVTIEALIAVAEHIKKFGQDVVMSDENGNRVFTLKAEFAE